MNQDVRGIITWDSLSSTQSLAEEIVDIYNEESLLPPLLVLISREQTGGKGRGAHEWFSPPGGIYLSVIIPVAKDQINGLPLKAAMALARFLLDSYGIDSRIRWPNDILVKGRKIAGLLTRVKGEAGIIGIGINLNIPVSEFVSREIKGAMSLSEVSNESLSFSSLKSRLVMKWIPLLNEMIGVPLNREEWSRWSYLQPGDMIRWEEKGQIETGSYQGLDDHGFMLVSSGEVIRSVIDASNVRTDHSEEV